MEGATLEDLANSSRLFSKSFGKKIDLWVFTHFDRDHVGNFKRISRFLKPEEIWLPWLDHSRFGIGLKNKTQQKLVELKEMQRSICSKDFLFGRLGSFSCPIS